MLCFTANVTLLLRVNDEFDGIWTSCGLRRRFRSCYGGFGFYNHSDIMTKMVWSQGGHTKRRLLTLLYLAGVKVESWKDRFKTYGLRVSAYKCMSLLRTV